MNGNDNEKKEIKENTKANANAKTQQIICSNSRKDTYLPKITSRKIEEGKEISIKVPKNEEKSKK